MDHTDEPGRSTYRLYRLNQAGRIDSVADAVRATSDDDAVRQAEALSVGRTVELWQGARKVAVLNGQRSPERE